MPIPAILATIAGGLISSLVQNALGSGSTSQTGADASQGASRDEFMRQMLAQSQSAGSIGQPETQTTSYTPLEQIKRLGSRVAQGGNGAVASASALLGKRVAVNGSRLSLDGSNPGVFTYTLPASASGVVVRVLDANGNLVRSLNVGQQGGGAHQVSFDGLADNGTKLPAGGYSYQVVATDKAKNTLPGVYTGIGSVTGVTNQGGTLMLEIDNQCVPFASVVGVLRGTGA